MKQLFVLFSCLALFVSCSKNESGNKDKDAPNINPISPTNRQVFSAGQTVPVNMLVTDNDNIFVVHIHISNINTGQLYFDIHRYPDTDAYAVAESFTAAAGVEYKIQVIARDDAGNETNKTVIAIGQ